MASREEVTLPATRPKSRKSIASMESIEGMEKENMTADIGALSGERPARKSRSKSLGPGGLDGLKEGNGNRRKSAALPPPKSILKTTIPPVREIPAHISMRKPSPKKNGQSPGKAAVAGNRPNSNSPQVPEVTSTGITGSENLPNPFSIGDNAAVNETRVLLRTEEEQQAAAREREAREREEAEKDAIARRDARRKSLANRRVSFAPEATLHTWDVVEYFQDSTTSSASTNSGRRASSTMGSPHPKSPGTPGSDGSEPPSTPPEQTEDEIVIDSPADQRGLHQKKRRRSSGIPPLNFNNPDDEFYSSSPSDGDSAVEDDNTATMELDNASESGSDSENDDDDGTAMSVDAGDATATDMSMASVKSGASSTGSSARLDEQLALAARQAGTQGIEFDENGEYDDGEGDEIVASFTPWSMNSGPIQNLSSLQDQENLNPFSPAFKAGLAKQQQLQNDSGEEMTMEMTRAVGGILPADQSEDDMTMDMTRAVGRIIPGQPPQQSGEDVTMEMTQAVGRIMPAQRPQQSDDDMTMDMTMAVGGIIPPPQNQLGKSRRKSVQPSRRQSMRRRSSGERSSMGDETMEFTMPIGGIKQQLQQQDVTTNSTAEEEDMTMEFTSVVGGVLAPNSMHSNQRRQSVRKSRESVGSTMEEADMEMTVAVGKIMPAAATPTKTATPSKQSNDDVKSALAEILPQQPLSATRPEAKRLLEEEVDHSELASSPFQAEVPQPQPPFQPPVGIASETGSPSLNPFKGRGLRRSTGLRNSITPKASNRTTPTASPVAKPATPSKQLTPQATVRPTTPSKTPPSKNVLMRTGSPTKLFTTEALMKSEATITLSKKMTTPNKLFQRDAATGAATPSIVLNPHRRRSSGMGIDKEGLGSPRVAAILDRRGSIGEKAAEFSPGNIEDVTRGVRFDDVKVMEEEIDKAREEDQDREDGRKIMEREADAGEEDKDATIQLKEAIESLTPKKRPLKGRKSLHVGAAKGLLGKRPVELDADDDEDEDEGGVKRLKNHQGSPVKNVKLQAPPSKAETTGRLTRATRRSLEATSGNIITPTTASSPSKATTPRAQGRFKDAEAIPSAQKPVVFEEKAPIDEPMEEEAPGDDRIQLQDFLNMTSIRFMELTTTKRRHTVVPKSLPQDTNDEDVSLESCIVAGACTVPMLELFQHSCRELKKYISEGRSIVREIESETFEENPPLFREYISATPDMKVLMDNQFKNVKTHARLLSKAMWYEWRMKLLEGLKSGLYKIRDGMNADEEILQAQKELLDTVLPSLLENHSRLSVEESDLQLAADELASCDQDELNDAREKLVSTEADIEAKKAMIQDLQNQLLEKEVMLTAATERKQACLDDIREAEKIREECRGWTGNEIASLTAKVDALEQKYGWTVTGVSGTVTSLSFRGDLELVFDASSFKPNDQDVTVSQASNSRLDLWYIAGNRERNPLPITPEKSFFLENIRDDIRALPQAQTSIKELLHAVSSSWESSMKVVEDIKSLTAICPTEISKTSDSSMVTKAMLLLVPLESKVELQFHVTARNGETGLELIVEPKANVVYGEKFNEKKMAEFLQSRIGGSTSAMNKDGKDGKGRLSWSDAVTELEEKLLARGKK